MKIELTSRKDCLLFAIYFASPIDCLFDLSRRLLFIQAIEMRDKTRKNKKKKKGKEEKSIPTP